MSSVARPASDRALGLVRDRGAAQANGSRTCSPLRVVLVSPNVGLRMGGEAIKAYQYFHYLLDAGWDVHLVVHSRCREEVAEAFPTERVRYVEETSTQTLFWRSRALRFLITPYFHVAAARLIREMFPCEGTLIHYLCPISPVAPRLPPRDWRFVIGPLSGNISYPPAFRARMGRKERLLDRLHIPIQRLLGRLWPEKRYATCVLVSGGERTRASLRAAGCSDELMLDVADAGVSPALLEAERPAHEGVNGRFVASGRFVDYKGIDLAIRAVARCPHHITLDVFGDGPERDAWRRLAEDLGVADRVTFLGWLPHEELADRLRSYRGYVFPTLAEANGIVMQEAMALGLPVVALRWGGPADLADDESVFFLMPDDEERVVEALATAMTRLAEDAGLAKHLARRAHEAAAAAFPWPRVVESWTQAYR